MEGKQRNKIVITFIRLNMAIVGVGLIMSVKSLYQTGNGNKMNYLDRHDAASSFDSIPILYIVLFILLIFIKHIYWRIGISIWLVCNIITFYVNQNLIFLSDISGISVARITSLLAGINIIFLSISIIFLYKLTKIPNLSEYIPLANKIK